MSEDTKRSPLVLVVQNPYCAKRRVRVAWHLEIQPLSFLLSRRICSPFFLACSLKKREDGSVEEVKRIICSYNKGISYILLPSQGFYTIRAFIAWPKKGGAEKNFMKRVTAVSSFTKKYSCGVLGYSGEIDHFHLLASEKDPTGHFLHRMRESVMGPDYYLYDLNASIEINVTL